MVCVKHSTSSILFLAGCGSDEIIIFFFFLYSAMWVCVLHGGWRQLRHRGWNLGSKLENLFLWKLDCTCNLYRIALFKKKWWNWFGLITESLKYLGGDSMTWNDMHSVCYQLGRQREGGRKHQREPNEVKTRKERAKKRSETEGERSMLHGMVGGEPSTVLGLVWKQQQMYLPVSARLVPQMGPPSLGVGGGTGPLLGAMGAVLVFPKCVQATAAEELAHQSCFGVQPRKYEHKSIQLVVGCVALG